GHPAAGHGTASTRATPATVTPRSARVIERGSILRLSSCGSGSPRKCSPTGGLLIATAPWSSRAVPWPGPPGLQPGRSKRGWIGLDWEPGEVDRSLVLRLQSGRVAGELPRLIHRLLLLFGRIAVQASRARLDIASPETSDFPHTGVELGLTPV